jgi:hypothetical protein
MTIGINPEDCEAVRKTSKGYTRSKATAVGKFTDSGAFVVRYGAETGRPFTNLVLT